MGHYSKLLRHIVEQGILPREARILIGVSGGSDSIALLALLQEGAQKNGWKLAVAHLNHGLRGKASAADARWVKAVCKQRGIKVHSQRVDVATIAKGQPGLSIEMAARQLRYQFFAELVKRHKYDCVALGHTQDDQAETVLLNLLRGTGSDGLSGMETMVRRDGLLIVRPLLSVPKKELIEYLHRRGLEWREDATNSDPSFMRNRVRAELLPLLSARFNPQMVNVLSRTATNLRHEKSVLRETIAADLMKCTRESRALDLVDLRKLSASRQVLVVRYWLQEQCEKGSSTPSASDVSQVLSLCATSSGSAERSLGWGTVRRTYDRLSFLSMNSDNRADRHDNDIILLEKPGVTPLQDFAVTIAVDRAKGFGREPAYGMGVWPVSAYLSARYIGRARLSVRAWQPGDRFHPVGGRRRKVQDIFTDNKISRDLRHLIPLIVCREEILWIPGHRIAAAAAVESAEAKSWRLQIEANG